MAADVARTAVVLLVMLALAFVFPPVAGLLLVVASIAALVLSIRWFFTPRGAERYWF